MTVRGVRDVFASRPTIEGAGVRLRRAFGAPQAPRLDPFLMLDDFRSETPEEYLPGFPWHPHRGIETITYLIDGAVEHGDSIGNSGVIGPGNVQWMTAGSGIIHQEMPAGNAQGRMGGFQLWANLPAAEKMTDPRYRGVASADIPEVTLGDATVRVISGEVAGTRGPVRDIVIDPEYLDVTVAPGGQWSHQTTPGHTVLAYLFGGAACFSELADTMCTGDGALVLFDDGEAVEVVAGDEGARFLFLSGRPLHEPVAWRGPIVMNTQEELRRAFEEYSAGTFVKVGVAPGA